MYSRCFKFTLKRPRNNHTAYWSTFCFLKFLLEFFFYIYCKDTLPVQTFSFEAEVLGSLFLLPLKQSLFLGLSIKPKQVKNISTMSIRCGIFKLLYMYTSTVHVLIKIAYFSLYFIIQTFQLCLPLLFLEMEELSAGSIQQLELLQFNLSVHGIQSIKEIVL